MGESLGIRLSSVQKVENLDPVGYPINHDVVGMDNNFPGAGDPAEAIKAGVTWKGRGSRFDRGVQLTGRNGVTVSDVVQGLPELSASFRSPVNPHCFC